MKQSSFYLGFGSLFLVLSLVIILAGPLNISEYIHDKIWVLQGFFLVTVLLSHLVSVKGVREGKNGTPFFIGSIAIRFLFSLFFIFIIILLFEEKRFILVVDFFILYLLYMSFEFTWLILNLRAENNKS